MMFKEVAQGFGPQQGHIAAKDQSRGGHIFKKGDGLLNGMACAELFFLKGEFQVFFMQGFPYLIGLITDDEYSLPGADLPGQIRGIENHGPSQKRVEDLYAV
jgi:hypothetical protein